MQVYINKIDVFAEIELHKKLFDDVRFGSAIKIITDRLNVLGYNDSIDCKIDPKNNTISMKLRENNPKHNVPCAIFRIHGRSYGSRIHDFHNFKIDENIFGDSGTWKTFENCANKLVNGGPGTVANFRYVIGG